jgi:hypothetical protein
MYLIPIHRKPSMQGVIAQQLTTFRMKEYMNDTIAFMRLYHAILKGSKEHTTPLDQDLNIPIEKLVTPFIRTRQRQKIYLPTKIPATFDA